MNKGKWLEISGYIYLGLIVLGTIAATVNQQVVYAVIPLILIITNIATHSQFNYSQSQDKIKEVQTSLQNITDQFYQRVQKSTFLIPHQKSINLLSFLFLI